MKRHPGLCRSFSKNGSCWFNISCSFLYRPGQCLEILEEIKVLKTEIEDIKAQNELLKNMLQTLNSFESEIKIMKDMLKDIIIKINENNKEPNQKDISEPILNVPGMIPCEDCDCLAKSKAGLKTHIRTKHPKPNNKIENKSESVSDPFTCGNCEFNFKSHDSDEVFDHYRDVHGWFLCRNWLGGDSCEHDAENKEDSAKHMRTSCEYRNTNS